MAYNSDSATDRLSAVRDAIERCLVSQEYGTGVMGHRQRMAELKTLREMEVSLQEEVASAATSGGSMASLAECGRVL